MTCWRNQWWWLHMSIFMKYNFVVTSEKLSYTILEKVHCCHLKCGLSRTDSRISHIQWPMYKWKEIVSQASRLEHNCPCANYFMTLFMQCLRGQCWHYQPMNWCNLSVRSVYVLFWFSCSSCSCFLCSHFPTISLFPWFLIWVTHLFLDLLMISLFVSIVTNHLQWFLVMFWLYSISQKWVHPSHICKYFIISFHVTTLKKWHFATM